MPSGKDPPSPPPGTAAPQRFRPRLHYELLVCGVRGHELVGTDVRELRSEDAIVAREEGGVRWHRCLRCDSWLPLPPPAAAARDHLAPREQIELPLRGKALRDKIVLRVIAIDRALHVVILAALAVAVFLIAAHERQLREDFYRVLADVQGGVAGGPLQAGHSKLSGKLGELFSLDRGTLHWVGAGLAALAMLEAAEAIGLWFQRRWAEYLTFVATTLLLPLEVYELTSTVSWFKVTALIVNIAIVVYLLLAKRLFGLRGGPAADRAERERDMGWEALERTEPGTAPSA
ncbi:MAG TPA: DUF2127 domain-containing protein [Solirubrobacterales bacterium]|nr:DUF2127 domain-containing protein [Solirubrobacterales bacterium]